MAVHTLIGEHNVFAIRNHFRRFETGEAPAMRRFEPLMVFDHILDLFKSAGGYIAVLILELIPGHLSENSTVRPWIHLA